MASPLTGENKEKRPLALDGRHDNLSLPMNSYCYADNLQTDNPVFQNATNGLILLKIKRPFKGAVSLSFPVILRITYSCVAKKKTCHFLR